MIYELLLLGKATFRICSPRRRWAKNAASTSATANFVHLIQVNKQIQVEASTTFYSLNTFIIGNGNYGSSMEPNIHALKSFIRRVPARYIGCISRLSIIMYLRDFFSIGAPDFDFEYGITINSDASDLQTISRVVLKYFTGVKILALYSCTSECCTEGPERYHDRAVQLSREESVEKIAKAIKMLLKHPSLQNLRVAMKTCWARNSCVSQLQEAAEKAINETGNCNVSVKYMAKG
jgi:hypothetical protein